MLQARVCSADPACTPGDPVSKSASLHAGNGRLCGAVPKGFPLAVLQNSSAASSSLGFATPVAALTAPLCWAPQLPAAALPVPAQSKQALNAGIVPEEQLASAG